MVASTQGPIDPSQIMEMIQTLQSTMANQSTSTTASYEGFAQGFTALAQSQLELARSIDGLARAITDAKKEEVPNHV